MKLHFDVQGTGTPLIILHGLLGSAENWRGASKRLSSDYRVYAIDLRNHGNSPHSGVMTYTAMAEDVRELLDDQHIQGTSVLGHSMGGKVAMQLATSYPTKIAKVVAVDIAPKGYPPSQAVLLSALRNLDLQALRSFAEFDAALAMAAPEARTRQFLMKNLVRASGGGFRWRNNPTAIADNYPRLLEPILAARPCEKPACFIRGGRSDYVQDHDLSLIKEMFPRARILTIAGAGHWLHVDAPEAFHRAVSAFLSASDT